MSAYIVAQVEVTNWEAYREYARHTPRVIDQFGGRFIVRGGDKTPLEGPADDLRLVIIEFPSLEQVLAFYNSAAYQQVKKLRDGAGTGKFMAVDGYPEEEWREMVRQSSRLTLP
ncbi:MAG: DUF1330 domain-containing protein [Blastocatellia bacterium]